MGRTVKKVLFVCANSGRSQMARAFFDEMAVVEALVEELGLG